MAPQQLRFRKDVPKNDGVQKYIRSPLCCFEKTKQKLSSTHFKFVIIILPLDVKGIAMNLYLFINFSGGYVF